MATRPAKPAKLNGYQKALLTRASSCQHDVKLIGGSYLLWFEPEFTNFK